MESGKTQVDSQCSAMPFTLEGLKEMERSELQVRENFIGKQRPENTCHRRYMWSKISRRGSAKLWRKCRLAHSWRTVKEKPLRAKELEGISSPSLFSRR